MSKRVLVACEESQEVTKAFRKRGHEAYSCDLQDCSGGHPEWHIKDSIFHVLHRPLYTIGLDILIAHPPCTYLANSGVRWLYNKDGSRNKERWDKMENGALFFKALLNSNCGCICIENPIMHKHALAIIGTKPTQIIQPWQFGHGETKATCLWLIGLPKLKPTNIVEGREQKIWRMAPSPERAKLRSKTYPGIAEAMADQWGGYTNNNLFTEQHKPCNGSVIQ
jgi:hypothetical protein